MARKQNYKKYAVRVLSLIVSFACVFAFCGCYRRAKNDPDAAKFSFETAENNSVKLAGCLSGSNEKNHVKVPRQVNGKKVVAIGSHAFSEEGYVYGDEKYTVILPDTVEIIEEYAFASSSVSEIYIPDSVKEIGEFAFSGCRLTEVSVPKTAVVAKTSFDEDVVINYRA